MSWRKNASRRIATARADLDNADDSLTSDTAASRQPLVAARSVCKGIIEAAHALSDIYEGAPEDVRLRIVAFCGPAVMDGVSKIINDEGVR